MNDMVLVPDSVNVPKHLAKRVGTPSALNTAVTGGLSSGTSHPRIAVKGTRWKFILDGEEKVLPAKIDTLKVAIIGANPGVSKIYYASAYDPDAAESAPDCFSQDGKRPHSTAVDPQHDVCASCPKNAWGSQITESGKQLKACRDSKTIAVVLLGFGDNEVVDNRIWQIRVSPSSLKHLARYTKLLGHKGFPMECVQTELFFSEETDFPQVQFKFAGFIDASRQSQLDAMVGSAEVMEVTGEEAGSEEAAPVAKAAPKPKPDPEPEPEPEEEEEEEEEEDDLGFLTPAPKKVAKKKASKKKAPRKKAPEPEPEEEEEDDDLSSQLLSMLDDD